MPLDKSDEITFKELIYRFIYLFKFLRSKWLIILVFGTLGGALGFTYAYLKKPTFTSTTTFVLESGSGSNPLTSYAGLASMVGLEMGGSGGGIFQGDNILELYKSNTMIRKTLLSKINIKGRQQTLIEYYLTISKIRDSWEGQPNLQRLNFNLIADDSIKNDSEVRLRDSVIGQVVENINRDVLKIAKPDAKLSIVKVDVKSTDEVFAKIFNDEIVRNVNEFYIQTKTRKSLENVQILERKRDSVRSVLNGNLYSGAQVADATPNLNPTRQVQRVVPLQRSQFSAETNKAILSSLIQNLELAKMSIIKETPLIQVVDYPIFPLKEYSFSYIKGILIGFFALSFFIVCFLSAQRAIKIYF